MINPFYTEQDENSEFRFEENGVYRTDVVIHFGDEVTGWLNGNTIDSGVTVSESGDYHLILTNKTTGDKSEYDFTIMK